MSNNYFIGIGIDKYLYQTNLNNAVRDSDEVYKVLQEKYTFSTKEEFSILLRNEDATKRNIQAAFTNVSRKINSEDCLLVFYSGHGDIKEVDSEPTGYWIPHESRGARKDWNSCIANSELVNWIKHINAKHILIISDSCFAGALRRGKKVSQDKQSHDALFRLKSRRVFCSSRETQPAYDGRLNGHSPFTEALLNVLRDNGNAKLSFGEVYYGLLDSFPEDHYNDQEPIYEALKLNSHEGGEFILCLKEDVSYWIENDLDSYESKKVKHYEFFNDTFPESDYRSLAEKYIDRIKDFEAIEKVRYKKNIGAAITYLYSENMQSKDSDFVNEAKSVIEELKKESEHQWENVLKGRLLNVLVEFRKKYLGTEDKLDIEQYIEKAGNPVERFLSRKDLTSLEIPLISENQQKESLQEQIYESKSSGKKSDSKRVYFPESIAQNKIRYSVILIMLILLCVLTVKLCTKPVSSFKIDSYDTERLGGTGLQVQENSLGRWVVFDNTGELLPVFKNEFSLDTEPVYLSSFNVLKCVSAGQLGIIDTFGKIIVDFIYDDIISEGGYLKTLKNNVYEYKDMDGNSRLSENFDLNRFKDLRDNTEYGIVYIDGRVWMRENCSYRTENSLCYNDGDECKEGMLYYWKDLKNVCPEGWRIPNRDEWINYLKLMGGYYDVENQKIVGNHLSIVDVLDSINQVYFPMLGGYHDGSYKNMDIASYYWTSTEKPNVDGQVYVTRINSKNSNNPGAYLTFASEESAFPCKCIRKNENLSILDEDLPKENKKTLIRLGKMTNLKTLKYNYPHVYLVDSIENRTALFSYQSQYNPSRQELVVDLKVDWNPDGEYHFSAGDCRFAVSGSSISINGNGLVLESKRLQVVTDVAKLIFKVENNVEESNGTLEVGAEIQYPYNDIPVQITPFSIPFRVVEI